MPPIRQLTTLATVCNAGFSCISHILACRSSDPYHYVQSKARTLGIPGSRSGLVEPDRLVLVSTAQAPIEEMIPEARRAAPRPSAA